MAGYGQNLELQGLVRKILRNKELRVGFSFSIGTRPYWISFWSIPNAVKNVFSRRIPNMLVLKSSVQVVRHTPDLRKIPEFCGKR